MEACETGQSGYFGLRIDYKGPCIGIHRSLGTLNQENQTALHVH